MLAVSNETETANISGRKFRGPVITAKEPKNTVGVLLAGMGLLTWDMIVTCIQFNSRDIANISVDTSYLLFVIIYYLLT